MFGAGHMQSMNVTLKGLRRTRKPYGDRTKLHPKYKKHYVSSEAGKFHGKKVWDRKRFLDRLKIENQNLRFKKIFVIVFLILVVILGMLLVNTIQFPIHFFKPTV